MKRREAKALGLTRYFTGKKCPAGHLSDRFTSSGSCVECYEQRKSRKPDDDFIRQNYNYDKLTGDLTNNNGKKIRSLAKSPKSRTDYYRVNINGKFFMAHRVAWFLHFGEWPDGVIDHINGNGLDNRLENMRCVEHVDNIRNCRLSTNNTSGVNGVWVQNGRFIAEIMVNKKKISLGSYSEISQAESARKDAEIKYGFHDRHGDDK